MGVRRKQEREFSNWHVIQGINIALRLDTYVDGEMSTQQFWEEVAFNAPIPEDYFLEPQVEDD
jgi:hypothetical protein